MLGIADNEIASAFTGPGADIFGGDEAVVLVRGHQRHGQDHHRGQARQGGNRAGRAVILGSADTFRAAAIRQRGVGAPRRVWRWSPASARSRSGERVLRHAGARRSDRYFELVLITAGRLHLRRPWRASWRK